MTMNLPAKAELSSIENVPKSYRARTNRDACKSAFEEGQSQIDLKRAFATDIFTTKEAAYYLGVSEKTIWNWKAEGRIRAMTLGDGRNLRFHKNELNKVLRG